MPEHHVARSHAAPLVLQPNVVADITHHFVCQSRPAVDTSESRCVRVQRFPVRQRKISFACSARWRGEGCSLPGPDGLPFANFIFVWPSSESTESTSVCRPSASVYRHQGIDLYEGSRSLGILTECPYSRHVRRDHDRHRCFHPIDKAGNDSTATAFNTA